MEFARKVYSARLYDLKATLNSGQAFRWNRSGAGWAGILHGRWVRLSQNGGIQCETIGPVHDWTWLTDYLQVELDLERVIETFPQDRPMQEAVGACRGLRLLRQEPWECLASFILSSTKQIVQIRQIVEAVCRCFGESIAAPPECAPAYAFPTPGRIASASEQELRACKMGFRAPYLRAAAQAVAAGEIDLKAIQHQDLPEARATLTQLPGVGPKIANCVLLFAYGFQTAFPLDVWILRALRTLYFPRRKVSPKKLVEFSETHFGPYSGYAQQYLFHYVRTRQPKAGKSGTIAT